MAIDKWLDVPSGIDKLVQKKNTLSEEQWRQYMQRFYRRLAKRSPSGKVEYQNTVINVNKDDPQNVDYLNMINDLCFSDTDSKNTPSDS